MIVSKTTGGIHNLTAGASAANSASLHRETEKFTSLLESFSGSGTLSSSQIADNGRVNGDYTSGFSGTFTHPADAAARPAGAAANSAALYDSDRRIDKTSKLYEKSLELESFFVKMMLSSMRGTLNEGGMFGSDGSSASKIYNDMLYDELAVSMTKNAGFGLADQIYLSLSADA